ncbi:baseplate wedge subunit [Synechococcus phage S-N03]|uniref:Baseplate wedge subunit n=1 Tax=Synechococcus phage S-N03 TaxID=2718943 RepID=A0A6G8R672_9CAUD|nr:baseplate wedge subunit [Synechococcus phage S-N03]QIN96882.1 baseplate wedge subunit [Synechococcus phage S-N03]
MATVNTSDLRVQNAKNLVSSLPNDTYSFIAKPTEWSSGDDTPPTPTNNIDEFNDVYNQMLSMVKVTSADVWHMIPRVSWTSGLTYDIYRHDYSSTNPSNSGSRSLYNAIYYVINSNNDVYVCLFNNNNSTSTVEPRNTGDTPFYTSDGYQWLRVYNVTSAGMSNYTTSTLIPIMSNEVVATTDGAVYTVLIGTPGNNYTSSPAGVVNQIPFYYCNVVGDGSGAVAKVTVGGVGDGDAASTITKIEVVRSGEGYSYATLDFVAGRVYESLADLDNEVNGLNPLGDGTFTSTIIIGPPGGWGTDLVRELGGTRVGVFSSLNYDISDFLTDVTFRQVGLMKDIVSAQGSPTTVAAYYGVAVEDLGGAAAYVIGETIRQPVTVDGESKFAYGQVVGWDRENNIIRYIQDPKLHTDTDGNLYPLESNGYITGLTTNKITEPNTDFSGGNGGQTFAAGYAPPEVTKFSGVMVYLSNITPVLRGATQTEKVSIIISY